MEKRAQVFVSSTYVDLIAERQAVTKTLLELDCFPAGMELFPAGDDDKWDLIQGVIDDSDYYVLILSGKYGSIDEQTDISYTEMEYDYAVAQRKPVLGFIRKDLTSLPLNASELDPGRRSKLEAFHEKVKAKRNVKFFETKDELSVALATSIMPMMRKHPPVGWVRGDQAMTPEVRAQLAELRAALAEAEKAPKTGPIMENLAEGDETYGYEFRVKYRTKMYETEEIERDLEVTWDEILGLVGPSLLHEVPEGQFREAVVKELKRYASQDFADLPDDYEETVGTWLPQNNFDEIKVQLFALGLIERGTQKRTVSDHNPYWKLTQRGEDRLMSLRAIRKPGYELL